MSDQPAGPWSGPSITADALGYELARSVRQRAENVPERLADFVRIMSLDAKRVRDAVAGQESGLNERVLGLRDRGGRYGSLRPSASRSPTASVVRAIIRSANAPAGASSSRAPSPVTTRPSTSDTSTRSESTVTRRT